MNRKLNIKKYKDVIELMNNGLVKRLPAHSVNANGCWIAKGIKPQDDGYIRIGRSYNRKVYQLNLHVLSYFLSRGFDNASDESMVCHRAVCRGFSACYNPDHLYLGDAKSNAVDRKNFGVHNRGEAHGLAKLSEANVRKILELLSAGFKTTTIARIFNIDRTTISLIKTGKRWTHIPRIKWGELC